MPLKPVTFEERDLKRLFKLNTPIVRLWRQLRRALKTLIWFTAIFGLLFYAINGAAFWQRANFDARPQSSYQPKLELPVPATPTTDLKPEIFITKIDVRAPVIYDASYSNIIERLRDGVVRYEGTADPGQIGNVVIVGHSSDFPWSAGEYKTVFALLDKLVDDDEIALSFGANLYLYKVTESKVVSPTDLSVLRRSTTPNLTLITCYPVGTTRRRLVVIATLSDGPIGSTQATEPFLGQTLATAR